MAGPKSVFKARSLHYMAASVRPDAMVIRGGSRAGSSRFSRSKRSLQLAQPALERGHFHFDLVTGNARTGPGPVVGDSKKDIGPFAIALSDTALSMYG